MNINIKNAAVGFAFIALLASCSKGLEEQNISGVTQSLYKTESGFENGVNAAYNRSRTLYGTELGGSMTVFGTDTWKNGRGGNYKYYNQYTSELNPADELVNTLWNSFYKGINTINTVLSDTSVVDMDPGLKKTRIGELRFLRAFYYFDLVRFFGPVPLHLKPTESVTTEETRAPVADVYHTMIDDLNEAVADLPDHASDPGRATKGAAQQLLAMVYLTRGYTRKDQSDFDHAATLAENIIHSGQYRLLDHYADIFDFNNQQNDEVIWSVQYTQDPLSNGDGNSAHLYFLMHYDELPGMQRSLEYGRPWSRFQPTKFLLNLWNTNVDSRYNGSFQTAWICNDADNIPKDKNGNPKFAVGDTAVYMPPPMDHADYSSKPYTVILPSDYYTDGSFYPSLSKFLDPDRPSVNYTAGSRDFIVYRLGETYLIAAEALFQENKIDDATRYINTLRERAALPGLQSKMDISSSQLTLDFILDEWARETAGEYRRWFDLKRTGRLVSRVQQYNPQGGPNIKAYHVLRPIPQSEIDAVTSPGFKQNTGY